MTANHKWDVQQAGKILNTSCNPTILFVGFFVFPFYTEEFPISNLSVWNKTKEMRIQDQVEYENKIKWIVQR
jgi:hypothetical protein